MSDPKDMTDEAANAAGSPPAEVVVATTASPNPAGKVAASASAADPSAGTSPAKPPPPAKGGSKSSSGPMAVKAKQSVAPNKPAKPAADPAPQGATGIGTKPNAEVAAWTRWLRAQAAAAVESPDFQAQFDHFFDGGTESVRGSCLYPDLFEKPVELTVTLQEVDAVGHRVAGELPSERPGWLAYGLLALGVMVALVGGMVFYFRPRADGPPPDEFARRVADRVVVPGPDPAVAERLAELKAAVDAKGGPAGLTDEDREKLEKLGGQLRATAAGGASRDVLVVVTHASSMHAGDYKDVLHNVLIKDRARGKDQPTRVGLALGRAGQLDVRVPLDAAEPGPKVNLDIPPPDAQAPEEASTLGGKASKDVKWERKSRRAVLVVSTDCEPVPKTGHSWADFADVHVVMIARRPLIPAKDVDRLTRWAEFVVTTKGMVQLIPHADPAEQKAVLRLTLARLIDLPDPR